MASWHVLVYRLTRPPAHRGESGIVLLTSRVSVEIVQKAVVLAASILVAVSAPRALAVRVAQVCGMDACRDRARSGFRDLQPSAADCSGGAETSNGFFIEMLDCVISDRDDELIDPSRSNLPASSWEIVSALNGVMRPE
jgi:hypothetical protein